MRTKFDPNVEILREALGMDRVLIGEPMSLHTTYKIGGKADLFFQAGTSEDIRQAVLIAREQNIPFFILGLGANILVGDRGIRGLVIKNRYQTVRFLPENRLLAASGAIVDRIIKEASEKYLSGLEHFIGIPSTVGGAMWQNLHFLSPDRSRLVFISEVLERAVILTKEGDLREVDKEYFQFGYDESTLHHTGDIVLSVTFSLFPEEHSEISRVIKANLNWRNLHHPDLDFFPNAGSIFKRIGNVGAGKLIEQCGLKGKRIGGAQISEKHANFIINRGGAKARDVLALIDLAKEEVLKNFRIELKEEIGFIGEF